MSSLSIGMTLFTIVLTLIVALMMIPVLVWLERRVAGIIQDRKGPNRTNVFGFRLGGVVQSFADVLKLVFKEEYYPNHVKNGKWIYILAPSITFISALLAFMVIPFADNLVIDNELFIIQALPIDYGVLWYLVIGGVGIIGIIFGGWLSHNKYSLLGATRASSQMLGYELPLGLSVVAMIMTYGAIDFNSMVEWQSGVILGFIPAWGIIVQPFAGVIFIVAIFAETNRAPFNTVEGDSEIVAGHMSEYSAMKFAIYFMAEYIAMNSASAVVITMFFGGYTLPYLSTSGMKEHFDILVIGIMVVAPIIIYLAIKWIEKNNRVKSSMIDDGSRAFETKVFKIILISLVVIIEVLGIVLLTIIDNPNIINSVIMILQIAIFIFKLLIFNIFFIVVRWTLPRFRFDQVQTLGWKYLLPISILNIIVTAIIIVGVS